MRLVRPARPEAPLSRELRVLHRRYAAHREGDVATYIPALAAADPEWFGICLVTTDGHLYEVGDTRQPFTIQSISKPFTYGLAIEDQELDAVLQKIGVEPSGEAFNSISLAPDTGRPRNPMINAGAIVASSLIRGTSREHRLERLLGVFSAHAGRPLAVDDVVYASERDTGHRNRAIGHLLRNFEILTGDPDDALDLYFRQCSIAVDCRDLGVMAACLANGGTNPLTGDRALRADVVPHVLSVMTTCGMYDSAGEWVFRVGMPAKSGVAGGVLAVLPGQLGVGVFSPRLDAHGNSVRGVRVCTDLADAFGLHFLRAPRPAPAAIRRQYDLARLGSKRKRTDAERAWLDASGSRARVYDLAGDLSFAGIELVARRLVEATPELDVVVLDLTRGARVDEVAVRVLRELIGTLDERGMRLGFVGTQHHPRFLRQLEEALTAGERHVRVRTFSDADRALEWCESVLLAARAEATSDPHTRSLEAHDLCRGLTPAELETFAAILERRRFEPGALILREGDAPDGLYLLLAGDVSVTLDVPRGERRRLATVSAGMAFGDLALLDRSPRTADVRADTTVQCAVLPLDAFDRMSVAHPAIKIALLANLLRSASRMLVRLNQELASLEP
jgi:glutaminase